MAAEGDTRNPSLRKIPRAGCVPWAKQIDGEGLAIVWSGSKEVAELKQEQLLNAGPEGHATPTVKFSLGVDIEPLPG